MASAFDPVSVVVDVEKAFVPNDCLQNRPSRSDAASKRPQRLTVIANPFSGNGRGKSALDTANRVFAEAGIHVTILKTEGAKHAIELAKSIRPDETDGVVVIGGDGTLNEVLTGLFEVHLYETITLGLIAGGTGNSVALSLGLMDPVAAAEIIAEGYSCGIDVGKCSVVHNPEASPRNYWFVNLVGLGIAVDAGVTAESLRFFGKARYDISGMWHILKGKPRDFALDIDGQTLQGDISVIVIQNNKHMGAGLRVAPGAVMDDGVFDLVLLFNKGRLATVSMFNELKRNGRHIFSKSVKYYHAKKLTITPAAPQRFTLDGELFQAFARMEIEIVPKAIKLFASPESRLC